MEFESRLKGYVAETIIECLLCDAGYRVIRTGLEKRVLEPAQKLGLERVEVPDAISKMPDFLIIGDDQPQLTEIKYRRDWVEQRNELAATLSPQAAIFSRYVVIVCSGKPQVTSQTTRPSKYQTWSIRHFSVLHPEMQDGVLHHRLQNGLTTPVSICEWKDLQSIQDAFPMLNRRKDGNTLIKAANLIADIERSIDRVAKEAAG